MRFNWVPTECYASEFPVCVTDLSIDGGGDTDICVRFSDVTRSCKVWLKSQSCDTLQLLSTEVSSSSASTCCSSRWIRCSRHRLRSFSSVSLCCSSRISAYNHWHHSIGSFIRHRHKRYNESEECVFVYVIYSQVIRCSCAQTTDKYGIEFKCVVCNKTLNQSIYLYQLFFLDETISTKQWSLRKVALFPCLRLCTLSVNQTLSIEHLLFSIPSSRLYFYKKQASLGQQTSYVLSCY